MRALLSIAWLVLSAEAMSLWAQDPQSIADRAKADFSAGRIAESVEGFDRLAALVPSVAPMLWQRGIELYVMGRYEECAAQFASFHAVDPTDLENASWHFLCRVHAGSVERARASLLRAGPDPRVLRAEIYDMLAGRRTSADLLDMAGRSVSVVQFYAYLYVGLYAEARGERPTALEHLAVATDDRYQAFGGFMNIVARVMLERLRREER